MKRILPLLLCILLLVSCTGGKEDSDDALVITTASFPAYDAARAVAGSVATIELIVPPGSDSHSYEPSIEDVMRISSSDLFIYNGGESDEWITNLLSSLDSDVETFSLVDNAETVLYEEEDGIIQHEEEEGHDHDHLVDEHVWTSLSNEISIVRNLAQRLSLIDSANSEAYMANAQSYISRIEELREGFQSIVDSAERRILVVADRFPLLYFANEFGLDWVAAFPGCASQTEPSVRTVASLIDLVREEDIPVVLHMELANTLLSEVVADETGARVLEFNSCHRLSKRDFDAGLTYIDLMEKNLDVLREALN